MAKTDSGYSGTPLVAKLGLKDGQRVLFVDLPEGMGGLRGARSFAAVDDIGWDELAKMGGGYDVIHVFTASREQLFGQIAVLMGMIVRDGTIWVSWPKAASKVLTNINEDVVRELALPIGLVDVKVCAVDEIWSGLKLVIRKQLR